jgi:hypothetical protein
VNAFRRERSPVSSRERSVRFGGGRAFSSKVATIFLCLISSHSLSSRRPDLPRANDADDDALARHGDAVTP